MNWFYNKIKNIKKEEYFNIKKDTFIGEMFFFIYDPKYKDILPVWDKFPLVIPLEINSSYFLGLNLHYLPLLERKKLLEELIKFKTKKSNNRISYQLSKLYNQCIHRYLFNNIKSNLIKINIKEWDNIILLPIQKFKKNR